LSNGNMVLSFQSQSGSAYQLQYKNHLSDATWTALGSAIAGDGSIKSISDSTGQAQRFYRLSIQ